MITREMELKISRDLRNFVVSRTRYSFHESETMFGHKRWVLQISGHRPESSPGHRHDWVHCFNPNGETVGTHEIARVNNHPFGVFQHVPLLMLPNRTSIVNAIALIYKCYIDGHFQSEEIEKCLQ